MFIICVKFISRLPEFVKYINEILLKKLLYFSLYPLSHLSSVYLELEIDTSKILNKFIAILTYRGLNDMNIALYHDMAGPLLVIFLFGLSFCLREGLSSVTYMVLAYQDASDFSA